MADDAVTNALLAAARRGVKVEVVMTRQSDWYGAFSALARGGVSVRTYAASAPLYIHAKAIVVDPGTGHARALRRLAELLGRLAALQPRARPDHDPAADRRRPGRRHPRDGAGAAQWRP